MLETITTGKCVVKYSNTKKRGGRSCNPALAWVPDQQEVIWIDCNLQAGREMRDIHPFLVLSPSAFNEQISLGIGLPMTTAEFNADNPFAVEVGKKRENTNTGCGSLLPHRKKSRRHRQRQLKTSFNHAADSDVFIQLIPAQRGAVCAQGDIL